MNIVFENDWFLIINKPAGLVVNNSQTLKEKTLQNELSSYFNLKKGDLGIGERAGIVHRLDKETSGLLLVAKTRKAFLFLQEEFRSRRIKKEYTTLVHGHLKDENKNITGNIGRIGKFGKFGVVKVGREAVTDIQRLGTHEIGELKFKKLTEDLNLNKQRIRYLKKHATLFSLLSVFPKTGRTHQIRVHLKHIGNPVVSDSIYAPGKLLKFDLLWCPRLFLHAKKLEFGDVKSKKLWEFECDLPEDLKSAMLVLNESGVGNNQ